MVRWIEASEYQRSVDRNGHALCLGLQARVNYQRSLLLVWSASTSVGIRNYSSSLSRTVMKSPGTKCWRHSSSSRRDACVLQVKSNDSCGEREPFLVGQRDYLEREARNQQLGEAGELFVINFERARLMRAEKASLADRIEQVSATEGPSAGFDIRSFEENGSDRFVEAKTTKYGMYTPFFRRRTIRVLEDNAANYHIYRLFHFGETPRFFTLSGYVADRCQLTPSGLLRDNLFIGRV